MWGGCQLPFFFASFPCLLSSLFVFAAVAFTDLTLFLHPFHPLNPQAFHVPWVNEKFKTSDVVRQLID